jgi:hypothetical protein
MGIDGGKSGVHPTIPILSIYGICRYIWAIVGVNVGKYSIHGAYGILAM